MHSPCLGSLRHRPEAIRINCPFVGDALLAHIINGAAPLLQLDHAPLSGTCRASGCTCRNETMTSARTTHPPLPLSAGPAQDIPKSKGMVFQDPGSKKRIVQTPGT